MPRDPWCPGMLEEQGALSAFASDLSVPPCMPTAPCPSCAISRTCSSLDLQGEATGTRTGLHEGCCGFRLQWHF